MQSKAPMTRVPFSCSEATCSSSLAVSRPEALSATMSTLSGTSEKKPPRLAGCLLLLSNQTMVR